MAQHKMVLLPMTWGLRIPTVTKFSTPVRISLFFAALAHGAWGMGAWRMGCIARVLPSTFATRQVPTVQLKFKRNTVHLAPGYAASNATPHLFAPPPPPPRTMSAVQLLIGWATRDL
jgi:hypothetical protein